MDLIFERGAKRRVKCPEAPTESWPAEVRSELRQILPMHIKSCVQRREWSTSRVTAKQRITGKKCDLQYENEISLATISEAGALSLNLSLSP